MVYDSYRGAAVMFGGTDRSNAFGDTWEYRNPSCLGRERISKASCADSGGSNQLRVTCANGLPGDSVIVTLSNGRTKSATVGGGGKAKVKFRGLRSGSGVVTAEWSCGATDDRVYTCP